jgi:hypothetical protein
LWDWAFKTFDVDIDSDNNNDYDEPGRTVQEDILEETPDYPGKILYVNNGDINRNKIPDFADFIYVDKQSQMIPYKFTPIVIEIPAQVDVESDDSTLTLIYSGSDPLQIATQNIGTAEDPEIEYTPAEGSQRIWLKNADTLRNPNGVAITGDYVTNNIPFTLKQLGFTDAERTKVFYIEGIRPVANSLQMQLEYKI